MNSAISESELSDPKSVPIGDPFVAKEFYFLFVPSVPSAVQTNP